MLLPIFELEMKEKYFLLQLKLKIEKFSGNTRKLRKNTIFQFSRWREKATSQAENPSARASLARTHHYHLGIWFKHLLEARAEKRKCFRCIFGGIENKKKFFWDFLTSKWNGNVCESKMNKEMNYE